MSTFSRLVIDPNRAEVDPTLVMKLYDGSIIPANRRVGAEETERRLNLYHRPYHRAIGEALDAIAARGGDPVLVSVHSFTPRLRTGPMRPWHVGLLWDEDDRLVRPLLDQLRGEAGLVVGDNQPYSGALAGDCMSIHGTDRDIPHVLIEVRNDLIADGEGQAFWAALLAPKLRDTIMEMRLAAVPARWI
jgi:predicted N-formylglutamate amidohydrolase